MDYIIFGAGAWAREVAEVIHQNGDTVLAFIDEVREDGEKIKGISVLSDFSEYASPLIEKVIGHGYSKPRRKAYELNLKHDVRYGKVVSSKSFVGRGVSLGEGCVIFPFATLTCDILVGKHVHVGASAFIGHDVKIGDFSHVSHGVNIAGRAEIGENSVIWTNSTVRDEVKIGSNTIIGMGSVVTKDIPSNVLAYGNPAKVMSRNE